MKNKYVLVLIFLFSTVKMAAQQSTASKQVSTFSMEAPQLQTTKKIWLYLPINYDISPKKYPVIYMHQAQNLFDEQTAKVGEWNIDEKLDSLKAQVIIVGIENDDRLDELIPFKNSNYGGGRADSYLEFIVKNVKPEIDKKYRTKSNAKNTIIMGSSLGGLTSFYAILKYPEVFGKAGIFSPDFGINRKDIFKLTENTKKLKAKIYFLCGDNVDNAERIQDLNKMEYLINSIRCECMLLNKKRIVKGQHDNEKLWRDGFVKAYLWLF